MSRGELLERLFYIAVILAVLLPAAFGYTNGFMRAVQLVVFIILMVLLVRKIGQWRKL